jgi:hypothetical protein
MPRKKRLEKTTHLSPGTIVFASCEFEWLRGYVSAETAIENVFGGWNVKSVAMFIMNAPFIILKKVPAPNTDAFVMLVYAKIKEKNECGVGWVLAHKDFEWDVYATQEVQRKSERDIII